MTKLPEGIVSPYEICVEQDYLIETNVYVLNVYVQEMFIRGRVWELTVDGWLPWAEGTQCVGTVVASKADAPHSVYLLNSGREAWRRDNLSHSDLDERLRVVEKKMGESVCG